MEEQELNTLIKLFRTVFYLAKSERSFTDFVGLLKLQDANFGTSLAKHYANDKQAKTFMHYIAQEKIDELSKLIECNDVFGIIVDGSTDTAVIEEEIVLVRILDNQCFPITKFLSLEPAEKSDAAGLLTCITQALEDKGKCKDWSTKLVGVVADGASVNFGCKEGLVAKLRHEMPHIIGIHCCAHRFELALKDAAKGSKLWEGIDKFLMNLYKFYHNSPLNMSRLMEAGKALNIIILRPVNLSGTRWAPHRHRALLAVCRDWSAIANHLSQVALGSNDTAAKAKGLHQKLVSIQVVLMLQVFVKFFTICKTVSEIFQDNDSSIETVRNTLKAAKLMLDLNRFDAKGLLKKFAEQELTVSEDTDDSGTIIVIYKGVDLDLHSQPGFGKNTRQESASVCNNPLLRLNQFQEEVESDINKIVSGTEEAVTKRFE